MNTEAANDMLFSTKEGEVLLRSIEYDPIDSFRDAAVADLDTYLQQQQANGGIPNSGLVSTFRVTGEFTSSGIVGSLFKPIGPAPTWFQLGQTDISSFTEKHDMALLTAFLQSEQAVANTPDSEKTMSKITYKLTDLLGMIFNKDLFANGTGTNKPNLLEHLVQQQAGASEVTRFTTDLWKIAQDGGMTMKDGNPSNADLHELSKTLMAFAMQKYYEETKDSPGYNKELFTAVVGGIQLDMADVSRTFAAAVTNNEKFDLSKAKGFDLYFQKYLGTSAFTPAERGLILSMLPYMRDWYVQAGATGLTVADDKNRNAFMLGGNGIDALIGGTGADLLVGNGGADTLLDSDGQGAIYADSAQLTGGAQYGDARVHRDANGHTYTDVGGGNLVIDGNMVVMGWQAGNFSEMAAANDAAIQAWRTAA